MNHTKRYRRIMNEVREKSFPNLKTKWILVSEIISLNSKYSAGIVDFIFFKWIALFKRCRNYSDDSIKALFAHELAHADIINKMSFPKKLKFIVWLFSKRVRAKFETEADKLTIKKGYGIGLIKLKKEANKGKTKRQLVEKQKEGYLSVKQIKQYMKK